MKEYELISLVVGFSAIIVIVYYLLMNPNRCVIFGEPIWWIRIPEIIIGLIVMPYFIYKMMQYIKER